MNYPGYQHQRTTVGIRLQRFSQLIGRTILRVIWALSSIFVLVPVIGRYPSVRFGLTCFALLVWLLFFLGGLLYRFVTWVW